MIKCSCLFNLTLTPIKTFDLVMLFFISFLHCNQIQSVTISSHVDFSIEPCRFALLVCVFACYFLLKSVGIVIPIVRALAT